jgi:Tol biopolymer transport system component
MFTASTKGAFPAGRAYGYVHFQPGPGIVASFNSSGGANTVTPGPTGIWKVQMAGLGSSVALGGIQVTAVNPSAPAKCEVDAWSWSSAGAAACVR